MGRYQFFNFDTKSVYLLNIKIVHEVHNKKNIAILYQYFVIL